MTRFCSIFNQLLQLFPRTEFQQAVTQTRAERHARGFTCWQQFVAMLFCQLGRAHSLREICGGLASCEQRLGHLGIQVPKRATLSYANAHRPWQLYQHVFYHLLDRCRAVAPGKRCAQNKLLSLDATVIDLCAELFPWATFRRRKGAVNCTSPWITTAICPPCSSSPKGNARKPRSPAPRPSARHGARLRYGLPRLRLVRGPHSPRRLVCHPHEGDTDYPIVERGAVPARGSVLTDDRIQLGGPLSARKSPGMLRRVTVAVPETGEILAFLTNHLGFCPTTIARIYKDRWQIELFFKALKQNLRVKTFVGTSANALHTQIWTALIALLLLRYLQFKCRFGWSLSNLAALLRMNLLVYRDLWTWLEHPFTAPPPPLDAVQGVLPLGRTWTTAREVSS